jgi:hypothetical protein
MASAGIGGVGWFQLVSGAYLPLGADGGASFGADVRCAEAHAAGASNCVRSRTPVDDVAELALEGADGFFAGLAVPDASFVIAPAGAVAALSRG